MEFVLWRALFVLAVLCWAGLAIEKWSWQQKATLESLSKEYDVDTHSSLRRIRRDDSIEDKDRQCGFTSPPRVVQIYLPESKTYLSPLWLRNEVILIAASDHSSLSQLENKMPTNLWRLDLAANKDRGNLGFTDEGSLINSAPTRVDTLSRWPANPSVVSLLSADYQYLFVSLDAGKSWLKHATPSSSFSNADMWFSNVDSGRLLIKDNNSVLYQSDNFGKSWMRIANNVFQVHLGNNKLQGKEYIYYSVRISNSMGKQLYRRDPAAGETKLLDKHMYLFLVDGKYLFMSKQNYSDTNGITRRLFVSADDGKSFVEARLPALRWYQSYVLMTTHEVGAFIHINKNYSMGRGDLYTSDSTGESYTVSLRNHLYMTHMTNMIHDFYEVQSARGVYITSVREDDHHITTRISYDRGAQWSYLKPTLCDGKACPSGILHLHMNYSKAVNMFFGTQYPLPVSMSTAPHIIMAHGVIGHHLTDRTNPTRVFVSDDGGRSWYTSLPPGKYSYAISDYGNLLYAVQRLSNSTVVWVSHDRGKCFQKFPLDTTGTFVLKGLLGDFQLASLVGLALGVPHNAKNTSEWIVHAMEFDHTLDRPCSKSDYEVYEEKQCLLGFNNAYNLTKSDAICYNGPEYNPKAVWQKPCKCTSADFECDLGFSKATPTGSCEPIPGYNPAVHCLEGQDTYKKPVNGLRLVPGDICTTKKEFLNYTDASCSGHEADTGEGYPGNTKASRGGAFGLILVLLITVITAALCVAGIIMYKRKPRSVEPVKYTRYSKLPTEELPDGENPFKDDEDDDEMLR